MKPKQIFGYIRVSTEMQHKQGQSMECQKNLIEKYCKDNNYPDPIMYEDPAKSAKDTNRPKFQEMMKNLSKGTRVVVTSVSRLSRNCRDLYNIWEEIKNKKCILKFLDMPDLDTDEGEAMFGMLGTMAQYERKLISKRTSNVLDDMSRRKILRGRPRFGWQVVNRKMVEHPKEQEVIQFIRELIQKDPKITNASIIRALDKTDYECRKAVKFFPAMINNIITYNNLRDVNSNSIEDTRGQLD